MANIDVPLDSSVCSACLGMVSIALDFGDAKDVAHELRRMTPDLWGDGLSEIALAAVREARDRGVAGADLALAELEAGGGRSAVARAIVRKLASELSRQVHATTRVHAAARDRLELAPPEWN